MSRGLWILLGGLLTLFGFPGVAGADAPRPGNYESRILSIEPDLPGISVSIVGGDSFVLLEVDPDLWATPSIGDGNAPNVNAEVQVTVIGYRGEPYLRFEGSGRVYENQASPTKYLNEERFGDSSVPTTADPDDDPVWQLLDTDGSWAWHDHRTHWMSPVSPPGAKPGDQIVEGVVPLLVQHGNQEISQVDISVGSYLLASPSPIPGISGVLIGLLVAGASLLTLRTNLPATILFSALVLALVTGLWQVLSLPPETAPSILLWVLPAIGLVGVSLLFVVSVSGLIGEPKRSLVSAGLLLLGSINLGLWGYTRRTGMWSAILPTDAPEAIDRGITGAALAVGLVFGLGAVRKMFSPVSTVTQTRQGS